MLLKLLRYKGGFSKAEHNVICYRNRIYLLLLTFVTYIYLQGLKHASS